MNLLINILEFTDNKKATELENISVGVTNFQMLSNILTKFNKNSDKPIILLIDEVDTASNYELFLSFLGMLRNKYILADDDMDYTFHSVILAGVYDIKNLKLKLRGDDEKKYNSPWNIAINFEVDMSFNPLEIETMLKDFSHNENIPMETKLIDDKIYYYTSGYPFLVSKICEVMNQYFKLDWSIENIEKSIKVLLNKRNTLFDSLIKNLDNNTEFREFIKKIVLSGEEIVYVPSDSLITLGELYGFIRNENNRCRIHNRIFEQYIYNHLIAINSRESENITKYNFREKFLTDDDGLDFEKILFLAFIKPIINGVGFDFKEVQVSEEKRLDVIVTYNSHKYISELKIWNGDEYHKAGIKQLCDYLDIHTMSKGFLVVYNFNKNKEYKHEKLYVYSKEIFVIYI